MSLVHCCRVAALILPGLLAPTTTFSVEVTKTLPAGTRLYLTLDKQVTSRRGDTDVGETVPCRVWRDLEHEGTIFVRGGTPAGCRIDKVKRSNMGGIQGRISVGGLDTRSVDGQIVMLEGGYNKEGSGRKAVVWTVGLLLFWPALFVPGGAAELPPGTVFDVATVNDLKVVVATVEQQGPVLDLSKLAGGLSTEVLLDEFVSQEKPVVLKIRLMRDENLPESLAIDSVNGKSIEPLPVAIGPISVVDGVASAVCETKIKPLAKYFQKGINRFELAYTEENARVGTEVILDIQM